MAITLDTAVSAENGTFYQSWTAGTGDDNVIVTTETSERALLRSIVISASADASGGVFVGLKAGQRCILRFEAAANTSQIYYFEEVPLSSAKGDDLTISCTGTVSGTAHYFTRVT